MIPKDSPASFYADDNELSWLIAVHIDVARWPDWTRELYLDVRPNGVGVTPDQPQSEPEPELVDDELEQLEDTAGW